MEIYILWREKIWGMLEKSCPFKFALLCHFACGFLSSWLPIILFCFFIFLIIYLFIYLMTTPMRYGSCWARDWLSHSCGKAGSFNTLNWVGDWTHASTETWAAAVRFLTHCAIAGTPSFAFWIHGYFPALFSFLPPSLSLSFDPSLFPPLFLSSSLPFWAFWQLVC